jgi:acyl dehydratase
VPDTVASDRLLHQEDLQVGKPITFGHKVVTKDEIIAFAGAYDPQPMHLDEEAAKATLVGGLCASGYHTCAIMMRMLCDGLMNQMASLGSPGVDEVRWIKPVRPGDTLRATYTVRENRDLASRPDVGISKVLLELINQDGAVLATWITNQLTRRRNPGAAPPTGASGKEKSQLASLWDGSEAGGEARPDTFFEDRRIGETVDLGRHTFGRDEIIAFARQFDPQPFHLDEEAAKASLFGALCASGWHTAAIFIRAVVTTRMRVNGAARARGERVAIYGPSPGFRNLRWLKPVYVGDTIEFRARLAEKIDLKSRPERGLLANQIQGRNQKGEIVFLNTAQMLAERRTPYRP